jgi:tetratricopeptide (TPR) repeat protein
MRWQSDLPNVLIDAEGKTISLVAPAGLSRRGHLEAWLDTMRTRDYQGWRLDCDFAHGGVWAGVADLVASLLPALKAVAPDLVLRHDYELVSILPSLRRTIPVRHLSLTDMAPDQEQTRLYPPDRALRVVHGLVELLAEWKARSGQAPWLIVCDHFDRAGHLGRTFFRELLRRRGIALRLTLVLVSESAQEMADGELADQRVRLSLSPEAQEHFDPRIARAEARQLEAECTDDTALAEENLAALIRLWTRAGDEERVFYWRTRAFTRYTLRGYYQEALVHGEAARQFVLEHVPDDESKHASVINKLYSCYCAIGEPYKALDLLQSEALPKLIDKQSRGHFFYQLAMLYTRFLSDRDRDLRHAEASLDEGLSELLAADMPEAARQFSITFNRNGLALVRHRQGRFQEAIDLCREGYERLHTHLGDGEHRLHRSVLLYNIAQVYSAMGNSEEALAHFDMAIEIDPSYSEYFNERGNVYFRLERFDEAFADYQRALELSPPYPEVFVNLGQCLRAIGQIPAALAAYDRALDLKPDQNWVFVMRAECHEALGSLRAALEDFNRALSLDPAQFAVLANRACIHYELGNPQDALADLDSAIRISPETADLYQNRAAALQGCDRFDLAIRDLERYLDLRPDASDLPEVTSRLGELRGRLPSAPAAVSSHAQG